jgi:hypothetical protein
MHATRVAAMVRCCRPAEPARQSALAAAALLVLPFWHCDCSGGRAPEAQEAIGRRVT